MNSSNSCGVIVDYPPRPPTTSELIAVTYSQNQSQIFMALESCCNSTAYDTYTENFHGTFEFFFFFYCNITVSSTVNADTATQCVQLTQLPTLMVSGNATHEWSASVSRVGPSMVLMTMIVIVLVGVVMGIDM